MSRRFGEQGGSRYRFLIMDREEVRCLMVKETFCNPSITSYVLAVQELGLIREVDSKCGLHLVDVHWELLKEVFNFFDLELMRFMWFCCCTPLRDVYEYDYHLSDFVFLKRWKYQAGSFGKFFDLVFIGSCALCSGWTSTVDWQF